MTNTLNLRNQISHREKTDWFTVLPLELQSTETRLSGQFSHADLCAGLLLRVTLANEAGAFSVTVGITTEDTGGNSVTVYTSAALTANGSTLILIKQGGATNSLFTVVDSVLPRVFKVSLTYTGTPATDKADTLVQGCFI